MPELPEVETIVRKLDQLLSSKELASIDIRHPKPWQGLEPEQLLGRTISRVHRRAKIILIELFSPERSSDPVIVLIHLKMTGQLIYLDENQRIGGGHPTEDWISQLPGKHTRVIFKFSDGSQLFFNDQRLFGWVKALSPAEKDKLLAPLAPDINDPEVTSEYFAQKISRRSQSIKQSLMDNAIACGVGNIYACEALNLALINPLRPAKSLAFQEVDALLKAAKEVIAQGIELGGTTFDGKYVDVSGMAGNYQSVVRVYGREGLPCPNCSQPLKKIKLGGRGTYFCENCQV